MISDRRSFFRNLAGGAAATAAAVEVLRGAAGPTGTAEAAGRPFAAGHFALELDGHQAGFLSSAEGGHASAEVIEIAEGQSCLSHKSLGRLRYDDVSVAVGTGMSEAFYEWLQAVFQCQSERRSGAILTADVDLKEVGRLEFINALITEIGFPKLDASSKDPATFTVSFAPESTRRLPGTGKVLKPCATGRGGTKKWLASNFRLTIDGLDCKRVNAIDELVVKQRVAERVPGRIEFPNLAVTLPESFAQSFFEWHEDFVIDGNNGPGTERKGLLEFLTPNLAQTLFSIEFQNLGIFSLAPDKLEAGSDQIRQVTAEMYCEAMTFDFSAIATGC